MRQDKDRVTKWMLAQHADSILRLAGITGFTSWKQMQSEVVAPRRLLDGLVEIQYPGELTPTLVLVEIESYAAADADKQVLEDILLLTLEKGVVPEVVSIILKPKGNAQVKGEQERRSRSGRVRLAASWSVVQLWELDAEQILANPDVGVVPLAVFAHSTRPPEELVSECVNRIATIPNEKDREGMLVVTAVLSSFAFSGFNLVDLLRGKQMDTIMKEALASVSGKALQAELMKETQARTCRDYIFLTLSNRFGEVPAEIAPTLESIDQYERLQKLFHLATTCLDLEAFQAELASVKRSAPQ